MQRYLALALSCLSLLMLAGCNDNAPKEAETLPPILRVAPLPEEDPANLKARYQPLVDHIQSSTGIKTELVFANDYAHFLTLFRDKKVDVAKFGGVTYLKAHQESGALPLATRNIDVLFTSIFLVPADSTATSISELQGKSLAFGSQLSTSGHLMPRHYLSAKDIIPEKFFSSVTFSGAHDKTAYLVRDKKVDVGVLNANIARAMLKDGRLDKGDVRILWETPRYIDYVWSIQPHIEKAARNKILNAFMTLDINNSQHKKVLTNDGAQYYLAAKHRDFEKLENILRQYEKINISE